MSVVLQRNKKGQFVKGIVPHNKGVIGYTNSGTFKIGHKCLSLDSLKKWRDNGGEPWNKNTGIQTNTGRTHFKKGQIPHNYKGGISKTQTYKNFYNRQRESRKKKIVGSHTRSEWEALKMKYGYMCLCCKRTEPDIVLSQDHIVPIIKGGTDNIDNIQPLCRGCNSQKWTRIISYIPVKT